MTEPRRLLAHAPRVVAELRRIAEAISDHVPVELEAGERSAQLVRRGRRELTALACEPLGTDHQQQHEGRGDHADDADQREAHHEDAREICVASASAAANARGFGVTESSSPGTTSIPAATSATSNG